MAFDPAMGGELVLFGGQNGGTTTTTRGHGRARPRPAPGPVTAAGPLGERYIPAMAFDPATNQLVLFGGYSTNGGSYLNDTWTWTGTAWAQQSPPAPTHLPATGPPWLTTRPPAS